MTATGKFPEPIMFRMRVPRETRKTGHIKTDQFSKVVFQKRERSNLADSSFRIGSVVPPQSVVKTNEEDYKLLQEAKTYPHRLFGKVSRVTLGLLFLAPLFLGFIFHPSGVDKIGF